MDAAVDHGGYVTATLVPAVPAVELRKMVSRGTLEPAAHGVYRVPALPRERFDEFILARLWARARGVISHDSALLVHDLCDINPTRVHLTIPRSYRISRSGGDLYAVHHADLAESEIVRLDTVVATTIRRTLSDSIGTVPTELARQAINTAATRGAIASRERRQFLDELSGRSIK
jgi:predicted transcriptional regulator of viral defense system